MRTRSLLATAVGLAALTTAAADWPQWRGPNRDAKATGFKAPATWPKELAKKWAVEVGDGVATPALVGDKLYVFARQGGDEVTRCLDAATGKEVWQDKYPAKPATGSARGFPGPRASPTVADGKVVTLGATGTLSCLDAATGKVAWRKDDTAGTLPSFFTSSSPLVVGGLCIAQLGGERSGMVVAYDLGSGGERWKWTGAGTTYASPAELAADGRAVVAVTSRGLVALGAADGKELWQAPFPAAGDGKGGGKGGGGKGGRGGGMAYNAGSPVVDGPTVITSGTGRGTRAYRVGAAEATELWANPDVAAEFNTPVVKDGLVYGLSARDELFCLDAKTGKTAWTTPVKGWNRPGYGSVVDAGPVLLALTPAGRLIVFAPSDKEFKQLASYPVAGGDTFAYPVADGNRIYVKDKTAVTLWTTE